MNYRHAYHAGNFADVVKHVALTAIVLHLRKKDTAFAVIDTHAGRGMYDLRSPEATRTAESDRGIGRIRHLVDAPPALKAYVECVRAAGADRYPGSSWIAANILRPQDRLVGIESEADEAAALASSLAPFRKARAMQDDGYRLLPSLLPPPEKRGLVLIDPPYEEQTEFEDAGAALAGAYRRFATGTYALWFPGKSTSQAERLGGELITGGIRRLLRLDIDIAPGRSARDGTLTAAGLLIVNPPFGFAEEMQACLRVLEPLLALDPAHAARSEIRVLAGE